MLREKFKWRPHKNESIDAEHRGGVARSSDEVSVMGMERRGYIVYVGVNGVNLRKEGTYGNNKTVYYFQAGCLGSI